MTEEDFVSSQQPDAHRDHEMILVTGATGFVGRALCAEFDRRGMRYRAVSRAPMAGFHTIGRIDADSDWSAALTDIETVIHLAARVHVMREDATDPLAAFRATNVDATLQLARQAAAAGVRRFVFMSSIKVNGEATQPGRPFRATDLPDPQEAYGRSKWEAEQALFSLGRQTGMEIVAIRPPLVYGPGVTANFASLMQWAGRGIPLPLGRVNNRRSLVFVGNLVDFIILSTSRPEAANRTFLVSDDEDLSITALLQRIAKRMNRKARLLPVPSSLLDSVAKMLGKGAAAQRLLGSLQVDITETRHITGWEPPYSVEDGLARTVDAFLQEQRRPGN